MIERFKNEIDFLDLSSAVKDCFSATQASLLEGGGVELRTKENYIIFFRIRAKISNLLTFILFA